MNKRLQVKGRDPLKGKAEIIRLPSGNGKPTGPVNNHSNVKLPSKFTPWYPIFRAKKYDPL